MKSIKPLTLALTLSTITTGAIAQDFSKTVFFGDSLSDTGRLKEIVSGANSALGSQLQDSFTTNPSPVWTRVLAKSYGTSAEPFTTNNPQGTNYTVGAAQAGEIATWATSDKLMKVDIPSTQRQIQEYLDVRNGQADPNALYAVWIGANDLFAAAQLGDLSLAQQAITRSAGAAVRDVEALNQAGAKLILVPNIPDLSLTPLVLSANNEASSSTAKLAAQLYNAGLFSGLNQTTANVVPANTFKLLQEATSNAQGFGFSNVTGVACADKPKIDKTSSSLACTTSDLANANDGENYMFADAIHPSGRTHRILAQYYRSIIEAPAQIGQMSNALLTQGNGQTQQIQRRLNQVKTNENNWWVDGQVNQHESQQVKTDGLNSQVRLGADVAKGGHNLGLYAQFGQQQFELGSNQSDVQNVGFGIYHRYQAGQWRIQGQAGVEHLDIENTRKVEWEGEARQHKANGDGQRFQASMRGLYDLQQDKVTYTPYIGMSYQHLTVSDLLEEQASLSTAMKFNEHSQTSLQGEVGVNVGYQIMPQAKIYGGLGVSHEFNDDELTITASLPSITQYNKGFVTSVGNDREKTAINAHLGATWEFMPKVTLTGGIQAQRAGSDVQDITGFIGVNSTF